MGAETLIEWCDSAFSPVRERASNRIHSGRGGFGSILY
jgi:hypothetical protein